MAEGRLAPASFAERRQIFERRDSFRTRSLTLQFFNGPQVQFLG